MAEFLIYNKTHWYDLPSKSIPSLTGYERNHFVIDTNSKLSTAQKIDEKDRLTLKYARRYQRGDIVEARRDGGPRGKLEEEAFIFLQVLSVDLKKAKEYSVSDSTHKRIYFVDLVGLVVDSHQNVDLTEKVFNSRLKVKK